jgi:hypothetical protein
MNKKFRNSLLPIGLIISLVACRLALPPATPPTATVPAGLPVSYNGAAFEIPLELSTSADGSLSTDIEFPYIYSEGDPMAEHVVFRFTGYPVKAPREPRMMVFKASEYASYSEILQEAVTALTAGQDTLEPLPRPLVQGEFYAQAKPIAFKNGHGVRYLTQVLTDFGPINNEGLFYYFQGITTDGAYFISAIFPVNAAFLVANGRPEAVTPPEGVPFDWQGSSEDFPPYLRAVTQKLNDTPAEGYTPSLLALDRLIGSIQVSNP